MSPLRVRSVLAAATLLLTLQASATPAAASPLQSRAVWVGQPPGTATPAQLAAEGKTAGVTTVFVKAAEGTTPEPGFTPSYVAALRAQGVSVCAWTFAYGADPVGEAAAAVAAARAGAQCLVVDAEGQYDKRYAAAQVYVHALRAQLGASFPLGLAGQAEVAEHPTFPYSVFLGPGGFDLDMPQVYWRDLGLSVSAALSASIGESAWYGRAIAPVGQLYGGVSASELTAFVEEASSDRAAGLSFFDLEAQAPSALAAALAAPVPKKRRRVKLATVRPGADGDEVLWAQEHLDGAGARLPIGGYYGAQTARAVASFQRRRRLRASGMLDDGTWRALLKVRPRIPSWAKAAPQSAR
jgi:peptidoglycan hydrolase-like protein with peptidoglycan-binding domain